LQARYWRKVNDRYIITFEKDGYRHRELAFASTAFVLGEMLANGLLSAWNATVDDILFIEETPVS